MQPHRSQQGVPRPDTQLQTTPKRSDRMKRVRQKGTDPELLVRQWLSELGARYRLNVSQLPGTPDIANRSRRKAIFVNGCFWHYHDVCPRGRVPTRNAEFWKAKLEANRVRDQRTIAELIESGYDVLVIWECETEDVDNLKRRLREFWFPSENGINPKQRSMTFPKGDENDRVESFSMDLEAAELVREVRLRDGTTRSSRIPITEPVTTRDLAAEYDRMWLRSKELPALPDPSRLLRIVDLFSGCGGMSLGVREACRALGMSMTPVMAVDVDAASRGVYKANFSGARVLGVAIEELLDGDPGDDLTESERELRKTLGRVDMVVGGPPCQGHSDLNNHTRRSDPKNELFFKMARFAEVIAPDHVIIENVRGVLHDRGRVFNRTQDVLTPSRIRRRPWNREGRDPRSASKSASRIHSGIESGRTRP